MPDSSANDREVLGGIVTADELLEAGRPTTGADRELLDRRWALADPYRVRLTALAHARLGSLHDAEDCVSEAILRTVTFSQLDERRIGQFLFSVTSRLCADLHRSRARESRAVARVGSHVDAGSPHDEICDNAEARWMLAQLPSLPVRESSAMLALAHGHRPCEAAKHLGMSAKAFESAVGRARKRMKRTWHATLALLPFLAARVLTRARRPFAGVAAASVATAVSLAVTLPQQLPPAASAVAHQEPGAVTPSALHAHVSATSSRQQRVSAQHPPDKPTPADTRLRASSSPIVSTPRVHGGPLVSSGGGPLVSQQNDGEGPVRSVVQCLEGGLQLNLQAIGCPD